ncbi:complement C4-like [Pristis pectinata]|uniref:complement C4-like n=1 Tax=Pristis pectinata TaxID=685728 RepID=UPI00223D8DC1|nr:complement C4-like [Pristis pectinata]XP_051899849.1 complement C4-like [Pristis pectinata]
MLLPLLSFYLLIAVAEPTPSFLITVPSIVHVGVPESVSIQLHGSEGPVNFRVYCYDIIRAQKCSEFTSVTLNSGNGYREIKTITVSQKAVRDLRLWRRRQKYVYLVAESPLLPRRRMVPLKLSSKRGYIFIQTDKPIYTPDQNVLYRIFTLDHYMRPVNEAVKISLYNSRGMELMTAEWMSQKIKQYRTKIPDNEVPGIWRIEAQFSDAPMSKVMAEFEVKEFVLPRFDVKVQASEMFYLVTRNTFNFTISAKHTYGEPVSGEAHVRFGIIHGADNKTDVWSLGRKLTVTAGVASSYLDTDDILRHSGLLSREDLVGMNLYMAVTVVEIGSDVTESTELTSIRFVSSPYVVDLSKTARHFVPKARFQVVVTVMYPDGTPAANVPVKVEEGPAVNTDRQGLAVIEHEAPANASILNMKVTAGEGSLGKEFQEGRVTAQIYQSASKSYLHIGAPFTVLKAGQTLDIELQAVTEQDGARIDYYYYIVTSKGKVLTASRIGKADPTRLQLQVGMDMVPTFRLIAYYYVNSGEKTEIVANSVWIDVEDKCQGRVKIKEPDEVYKPGSQFDLHFSTNDAANVSFVAVDSAMYILNNKNKLTPRKVFEAMNSYDLGCFYGGGVKTADVFNDAGLSFLSDVDVSSFRQEYSCANKVRRQRRALHIQQQYSGILNEYSDHRLRKCCMDGLTKIFMDYTCAERAQRVAEASCRRAFENCCKLRTVQRMTEVQLLSIGRSKLDPNVVEANAKEQIFDETSVQVRSAFPQSWLWQTFAAVSQGDHKITSNVPDAITTWEIQAVGMFENKGFCVEEPKKMKVFRPFFLAMRLPYSVRRNEQIIVKVTLYNYLPQHLKVWIYMKEAEGLCSSFTSWENARVLNVPANSARSIDFALIPLVVGNIPINVIAFSETNTYSDAILKHLRVLYEGIVETKESNIVLNPKTRRSIEIFESKPSNVVPDADSFLYMIPTATILGRAVENSLDADGIDKLIKVPTGCAEQTAMHMAPTVFAVEYLDQSDQWLSLSAERKDEALLHIETGYNRILGFKKDDGSYGAWKTHPSSTWLTAFIVKIFSIVRQHIEVNQRIVFESVAYLIQVQKSDGRFEDPHPVLVRAMQGGIGHAEGDTSLTAFVTVALQHFLKAFLQDNRAAASTVRKSIGKAVGFLHRTLPDTEHPYTLAITAYALSFAEADSDKVLEAERRLKRIAVHDSDRNMRHWQADDRPARSRGDNPAEAPHASALTVETTAYGLLHALSRGDVDYARPIMEWLTEQQNYGGGFQSTQDTVIALEALSNYHLVLFEREEDVNIQLQFKVLGKSSKTKIELRRSNALTQKELKFPLGSKVSVEVTGHGKGKLNLRKVYHLMEETSNSCDKLHLSVAIKSDVKYTKSELRRKRDSSDPQMVLYEVCSSRDSHSENDLSVTGMAVVDITLLSGLEPDTGYLDQLKNGVEQYISNYEYKKEKLLLYLDTVQEHKTCIVFPAKQIVSLGLVQPADATLYDFYDPSTKCTITYNAPMQNAMVMKLCDGQLCTCAEGPCPQIQQTLHVNRKDSPRSEFACYSPVVDYAYKVQVVNKTSVGYFDNYIMSITDVFKVHESDEVRKSDIRSFLNRKSCRLQMKEGAEFLLMGKTGRGSDTGGGMQYLLSDTTWIEAIPPSTTCGLLNYRESCQHLNAFLDDLLMHGCRL